MPKTELGLINQPVSTTSHIFDGVVSDSEKPASKVDTAEDVFEKKEPEAIRVQDRIAGRVPVSSGALGLIHGVDSNLGAGMRIAVFRGLKEIGLGFVEGLYDNAGGDYDLPLGAALALKYREKKHESGSRYVKEDEVRKACDEAFRRDGREVVWIETEGVAELGGGVGGTLPIGALANANANFKLSGLIKYRRLEPYESASGLLLRGQAMANTVNVPITASLARQMPPGGEFEFTGEGQVSLKPELSKPLGFANDLGNIGATAKLNGACEIKGETTISVQRLPFGDEVLVKIGCGKSANASFGADLKAGLEMKARAYESMPELGRGFLKFVLDRLGLPDVPQFVKRFLQSQLLVKSRYEKRGSEIARFVFDLSKPNARKAYEEIFTRLSIGNAAGLVEANDGSVRAQKAGESATVSEKGAAAILGQTKLLLLSALEAEREGKVSSDGRSDVLFRDCKFEKTYSNWFSGEKKIKWEAVTVSDAEKATKQTYYHLVYSNNDRITEDSEIEEFLRFSQSLGIKTNIGSEESAIDPASAARALGDRDDTETRADIYFTNEGIEHIGASSRAEAASAFLAAHADISGDLDSAKLETNTEAPTFKLLERFQQISKMWFFVRVFYFREISRLRTDFAQLAPGRDIERDGRLLDEAEKFAQDVGSIAKGDAKSSERFFVAIAKASGFEYMTKIAALTRLASVEDTILHELSISGGGLTLGAVDEGEILHPEKAMHRMLTKIA